MTKLKAWIACPQFGAPSEVWVSRQLRLFTSFTPHVITWSKASYFEDMSRNIDVTVVDAPLNPQEGWGRWLVRLRNIKSRNYFDAVGPDRRALNSLLEETTPDVILAHFGHCALRVLGISQAFHVPVVAHFHGLDLSSSLANKWYKSSLLQNAHRFHEIIVVGNHQKMLLCDNGVSAERIHVIPCGVPTTEFVANRNRQNIKFSFICVSRLDRCKGVHITIEAFSRVSATNPNLELHVVGDGSEMPELRKLASQCGAADSVLFHGVLPAKDVQSIMSRSDAFLQHSIPERGWVEGFGVSISEASASGLPVIVTRLGGIVDQVVDNVTGFLVTPGNVEEMTSAMQKLLADRDKARAMGDAGRQHMVCHFDASLQAHKLETVLLSAIAKSSRNV